MVSFSKLALLSSLVAGVSAAQINLNNLNKAFLKAKSSTKRAYNLPSFYHTSDDISQQLKDLANDCPGMSLTTKSLDAEDGSNYGVEIDVVNFKKPGTTPNNKFFLLFGEHARELISPESSLHFLKTVCGKTSGIDKAKVEKVLADSEFQVVVNGNPNSRRRVEEGAFCLRVNGQGVDLNRNWDEKWEPQAQDMFQSPDTNPGPKAFSEPETNIFKALVTEYQPTSFLTIHSGTKGMYMPWAYDMKHLAKKNGPAMFNMLKTLDKEYCQCPFGAAGKEVGYECPGTCLDYVYDSLGVEYSFAFEIYTWKQDWDDLKQRFEEKLAQPSDFMQMKAENEVEFTNDNDYEECFQRFNPATESDFQETLDTWTNVYLDLAENISGDMKAHGM